MREFVKGRTADEKFKSISTTLKHFSRRLSQKVVGLIPATPVIRFVRTLDEDGIILNMICPANGRITRGCIYIESDEKQVSIGYRLVRKGTTESFLLDMKSNIPWPFNLDTEVRLGDMISLWADDPMKVKSVWLGFLYEISPEGLGRVDFVLKQLEEMEKEDAGQT